MKLRDFTEHLKDRTKVFRAFRDVETLIQFTDGWLVYYNYFKPHESLNGKTPAQEAHVKYDVKNWADLAKLPVSKEAEIKSHTKPKIMIITEKVNLDKAFKRKRGKAPRGDTHLSKGWQKERGISSKTPRITPKRPSITKQHYSKRGGGLTRRGDI